MSKSVSLSTPKFTSVQTDKSVWTKFVTMDPINALSFDISPNEPSPAAFLTMINKSPSQIIYKVKTTMPNNYLVRPNQGVIAPNSQSKVTVLFNHKLDSPEEDKAIAKDKFQVLMALAPAELLMEAPQDATWFSK